MRHLATLLAVGSLALAPTVAKADIIYAFETTLVLVQGPDTAGLDGKTVSFTATIPSGSVYGTQFGFPAVESATHAWTISGGSAVDGTYVDPTGGAEWYPTFAGWFSDGIYFNGIAGFDILAIWHNSSLATDGDPVQLANFAGLDNAVTAWSYSDTSTYDFRANASFSASEVAPVPEPSALLLLGAGLIAGVRRLRPRRQ